MAPPAPERTGPGGASQAYESEKGEGRVLVRSFLRALAPVMVLGVVVPLSGCSGAAADPDVSAVQDSRLTVDRPSTWATPFPVEAPWKVGFRLNPTSVEQLQVSGDFGEYVSAAEAVGHLIGIAQVSLSDFTVVQTRDLEVKNATSAQAVRYTITDNQGSQVFGEWVVAVRWPEQQSVAVSLLTPRYDPDLEHKVVDSLRFSRA
jgi:hypothetical protein